MNNTHNQYKLVKYRGNKKKYSHYKMSFEHTSARYRTFVAKIDPCFIEQTDMTDYKWTLRKGKAYSKELNRFLHSYLFLYKEKHINMRVYFKDRNPMNIMLHNLYAKNVIKKEKEKDTTIIDKSASDAVINNDKYIQSLIIEG